ncbi:MAG: NirD/YgiW/YdeI family stress tolerance protein [Campylobacteraceae bacterium]|jgi:uncharacterized protein (TIGR00156 family)|nr:NirD/YgiW/YdeI family stress tolerance protein [Campylobacteraceae bacterium]
MKKKFIVVLIFALSALNAQDGYKGPKADVVTVETTKSLRDDYPVTLRGKIEKFLGDERYLFSDETGTIVVEIDNKLWHGISADENDIVEITGEVDRELMRIEVEASFIKKVNPK